MKLTTRCVTIHKQNCQNEHYKFHFLFFSRKNIKVNNKVKRFTSILRLFGLFNQFSFHLLITLSANRAPSTSFIKRNQVYRTPRNRDLFDFAFHVLINCSQIAFDILLQSTRFINRGPVTCVALSDQNIQQTRQKKSKRSQNMDTYSEVLMEDLIDYNIEESDEFAHSTWTEQALDLFISILKNVTKNKYSNHLAMLEAIAVRMSDRNYNFSVDQIEQKYKNLEKMYTEKKERNQDVEPELVNLFEKSENNSPVHVQKEPAKKKLRLGNDEESCQTADKSVETNPDDGDEKKAMWTNESTKLFLELLEELRPQLGSVLRTKKQMWEEICRRLKPHGFTFTYTQVENKWKALLRHYRGKLELVRSKPRYGVFTTLETNFKGWPELFECTSRQFRERYPEVSFANDHSLPFDDDGYADEEPFDEANVLPHAVILDEADPVMIEDIKPTPIQLQGEFAKPSTESQKPKDPDMPSIDNIAKVIESFRDDNRKHQNELLQVKKMQLRAYKERTVQFTRIADGIGELVGYLKRKSTDECF